ncbi:MAG: hypothetical protein WC695_02075 [Candidatus Omnitrophota bacterium]
MKRIWIFVPVLFMALGGLLWQVSLRAQEPTRRVTAVAATEAPVKAVSFYQWLLNYTGPDKKEGPVVVELQDTVVLSVIDLLVSLACVWLAFFFSVRIVAQDWKKFLSFFLNLNIGWFVVLLLSRGLWEMLNALVFKFQTDLAGVFSQQLTVGILFIAVVFYIWLQARAFGLQFAESLKMFLVSQGMYFILVFLFFAFVPPGENSLLIAAQETLGMKPSIGKYVSDIQKVTSRQDILSLARIRLFHL